VRGGGIGSYITSDVDAKRRVRLANGIAGSGAQNARDVIGAAIGQGGAARRVDLAGQEQEQIHGRFTGGGRDEVTRDGTRLVWVSGSATWWREQVLSIEAGLPKGLRPGVET
jgi:hypothetical protein